MEADLQMVCRLNGGNLRDTGHSFEAGPMAALADIQSFRNFVVRLSEAFTFHHLQCKIIGLRLATCNSRDDIVEFTLPENHPDLKLIVEAAHHDFAAKSDKGNSLANVLSAALGKAPGCNEDLENIEFLIHVLSVNRAAGAIDDDAFEQFLQHIKTRNGRANLANRFAQELETEHGYEDET